MKEKRRRFYTAENVSEISAELGDNPRQVYGDMELLKNQLKEHGVRTPLKVVKLHSGKNTKYEVIDGFRRYLCLKDLAAAGFEIPVPLLIVDGNEAIIEQIMANEGKPFEAWELAELAGELKDLSKKEIAKLFGRSAGAISVWFKYLSWPESVKEQIRAGELAMFDYYNQTLNAKKMEVIEEDEEEDGTDVPAAKEKTASSWEIVKMMVKGGYTATKNKDAWGVLEVVVRNEFSEKDLETYFAPEAE